MTDKVPYLSKSDIDVMPGDTRVAAAAASLDQGVWWLTTSDKDAVSVAPEGRRFFPLDTALTDDLLAWTQWAISQDGEHVIMDFGTCDRPTMAAISRIKELLKKSELRPAVITTSPGAHAETLKGKTAHVFIIDECAPPLSPNSLAYWSDRLWPTDYEAIELRLLAQMENADTWRKLYMCDWSDHKPEPTEKEKKATHRETYLRHNKIKGKHRDPHARRSRPY